MSRIVVVGIGAEGHRGLTPPARQAIAEADEVIGSARQLASLPLGGPPRRTWPSPLGPLLDELVERNDDTVTCVLASGDPMLHGIGATLARRVDPQRLTVHPHPSAFALACARLGWPEHETTLVSAVGRPVDVIAAHLQSGRRIVAYVDAPDGARDVARLLRDHGQPQARLTVLELLGDTARERLTRTTAAEHDATVEQLHTVAIEPTAGHPRTPGLPDEAYESDGQLTKRHVRALTVATLAPRPHELLWDVGAGSGSIGIEWLRAEPSAGAIAIESDATRAERLAHNARRLGVPHLQLVHGRAPEALHGLQQPDVVFIGGGVTHPGLLDHCLAHVKHRLVANAVTLESEQAVIAAQQQHGGTLTRIALSHAEPIGAFSTWRPQLPVVQWSLTKT